MKTTTDPAVTHRHATNILRKQVLFASVISFCTFSFCYSIPDFPFDKRFLLLVLALAIIYLGKYLVLWKVPEKYQQRAISGLSFFALAGMGFVVHLSGGIASPFVFLYFAILVSEAAFSGKNNVCIGGAILSYLCAVLGEYSGLLTVTNPFSAKIYASPAATFWIVSFSVSFMVILNFLVKVMVSRLRFRIMSENNEKQAIVARFTELNACSSIGMMTHRIVHDLRGPLASIAGYIELERLAPNKSAAEQTALTDLSETVSKMSDALTNISRFGCATEDKKEKINMAAFFRNLVSIFAFHKDAQKVQFRQNFPEGDNLFVLALRQDLQQAYFNILKNAVEAVRGDIDERVVEISIRESAGMLEVDIMNNGQPIPEDILAKLFQKAVTGKPDGTGVGLLITHDLLIKNDISIAARNIAGTGVLISTRMPLAGV